MSRSSKIVLDVLAKGLVNKNESDHKGLSLRFYETLFHKNKIISNNPDILKHDFYHPNNMY